MGGGGGGQNETLPPLLDNFKAKRADTNIVLSADKMPVSRANALAGAVWVYGEHEPKNVNDGTRIELTRDEVIKPDFIPPITLADVPVSDADTETVVNLKEADGKLHPYLYLSNNHNSTVGGLLLRKNIGTVKGVWCSWKNNPASDTYRYWCENEFMKKILDPSVSSQVINGNIKASFRNNDSHVTEIGSVKCFALSMNEYGLKIGDSYIKDEGPHLPYFSNDKRRIAYNDAGGAIEHYTRTTVTASGYMINTSGQEGYEYSPHNVPHGLRPAIFLPLTFKLKPTPNKDGSYDMYEESSAQTLATGKTIADLPSKTKVKLGQYAGQKSPPLERTVVWDKKKEFYARQFTYNSKKQYQTMLEGATAYLPIMPDGQQLSKLLSGSKVKLGTWNDTPLQWKVARDTSDQSIRLVLEPDSVSLFGTMAYDVAEPSNSDSNRKKYGNSRYIYSNIHQWLNATKVSGWYTAQHSADAAPAYYYSPGFLSGWSENHIAALDRATLTTSRASIDGGGTETFVARVALISTTELGLQSSTGGGRLDIFNSDGDRATGSYYWTRTPHPSSSYNAYQVVDSGALGNGGNVFLAYGVRPLCIPVSNTLVSIETDSEGCYTLV